MVVLWPGATIRSTGRPRVRSMKFRGPNGGGEPECAQASMQGVLTTPSSQASLSNRPGPLTVTGEPRPLTPGLDLTACRLVQEGLTHTFRHPGHLPGDR